MLARDRDLDREAYRSIIVSGVSKSSAVTFSLAASAATLSSSGMVDARKSVCGLWRLQAAMAERAGREQVACAVPTCAAAGG